MAYSTTDNSPLGDSLAKSSYPTFVLVDELLAHQATLKEKLSQAQAAGSTAKTEFHLATADDYATNTFFLTEGISEISNHFHSVFEGTIGNLERERRFRKSEIIADGSLKIDFGDRGVLELHPAQLPNGKQL